MQKPPPPPPPSAPDGLTAACPVATCSLTAPPRARSLASFPGGVVLPPENLLAVPCDVLIPAAIGGVITEDNANDLQCKVCVLQCKLCVCVCVLQSPRMVGAYVGRDGGAGCAAACSAGRLRPAQGVPPCQQLAWWMRTFTSARCIVIQVPAHPNKLRAPRPCPLPPDCGRGGKWPHHPGWRPDPAPARHNRAARHVSAHVAGSELAHNLIVAHVLQHSVASISTPP